jgi:hypothetical protein
MLADRAVTVRYSRLTDANLNAEEIACLLGTDPEETKLSLQTLARYSCVIDAWQNTMAAVDSGYGGFRVNNPGSNFRLSHLGEQFVHAVDGTSS